jgi:DNA-binding transcriptional ArsR family regulator
MLTLQESRPISDAIAALGEPWRIRIVDALRSGPKNVTELATIIGTEVVNASHHLKVLSAAGFVVGGKSGRYVTYELHPEVWAVEPDGSLTLNLVWCRISIPHN